MQSYSINKVESAHLGSWLDIEREKSGITSSFPTWAIGAIMGIHQDKNFSVHMHVPKSARAWGAA